MNWFRSRPLTVFAAKENERWLDRSLWNYRRAIHARSCASAWKKLPSSTPKRCWTHGELLQQLHDHGVLQLLRGALGASDKLIETAVDAAKSDESMRAMRNALILGKMLGSINPEVLQCVAAAATETFGCYDEADH